ncbi:hypothetical protein ACIOG4_37530 [Streptomyces microflavus]|uniref:hypothetical protein n=1 Tax=Streptomyces microflavus TaxID=1919 RepID=UPI00380B51B6
MNAPDDTNDATATPHPDAWTYAPGGITACRLDPGFLGDPERTLPLVATWTRDELYDVAALLRGEAVRRGEGELADVVRALAATAPAPPVTRVEFVTHDVDGVVSWSRDTLWLHRTDTAVTRFEFPDEPEATEEFARLDERFVELLGEYSRADRPVHGAHLFFEVESGTFTVSSPYAL